MKRILVFVLPCLYPLIPVAVLLSPLSLGGAITVAGSAGTVIDWDNAAGWSGGVEPGALDSVVINQEKTVNVTSTGNLAASVQVANSTAAWGPSYMAIKNGGGLTVGGLVLANSGSLASVNQGILTIESGGSVTNSGALTINAAGTLNIAGGTYTDSRNGPRDLVTGAGLLNISGGSVVANSTTNTDRMEIRSATTINGGSLSSNARFQFHESLTMSGSNSSVSARNLQQSATTTIHWIFDAAGVGSMTFVGFAQVATVSFTVDGSSYAGGPATFNLITAGSFSTAFDKSNLTVVGLGNEGVGWNWVSDTTTLGIEVVPEPATVALWMGLAVLGSSLYFRQRRRQAVFSI